MALCVRIVGIMLLYLRPPLGSGPVVLCTSFLMEILVANKNKIKRKVGWWTEANIHQPPVGVGQYISPHPTPSVKVTSKPCKIITKSFVYTHYENDQLGTARTCKLHGKPNWGPTLPPKPYLTPWICMHPNLILIRLIFTIGSNHHSFLPWYD